MSEEKTLNLEHFEVVTAITQSYEDEIETYLLETDDEVLQVEFAEIVMKLYFAYMNDTTSQSLISMINNKTIPLSEVVNETERPVSLLLGGHGTGRTNYVEDNLNTKLFAVGTSGNGAKTYLNELKKGLEID